MMKLCLEGEEGRVLGVGLVLERRGRWCETKGRGG